MSDETEEQEESSFEWAPPVAEYVPCNKHIVIAPAGWEAFAETVGAVLVRVQTQDGSVEVLTELGKPWHTAGKAIRNGSITVVEK